jgi:hypothetical protein
MTPLVAAVTIVCCGQAVAQDAFPGQLQSNDPASLPASGRALGAPPSPFPSAGAPAFGGGGGLQRLMGTPQGWPTESCIKEFVPLREEAERRGKLIKAASERHMSADEACKLIGSFGQAQIEMIKYLEVHSASCGFPVQVADQLKNGHKGAEALQKKVCNLAQQKQYGPAGPSGDFDRIEYRASMPQPRPGERIWPPTGRTGDFEIIN